VGRPKKTTMEVKGEGKSGSKVNEMGEVPFTMDFLHSPLEAHKQEPFTKESKTVL